MCVFYGITILKKNPTKNIKAIMCNVSACVYG